MPVAVVYATPLVQTVLRLQVPAGATLRAVIQHSGILQQWPEINLDTIAVGVHGRLRALDAAVAAGERIEIYRPLTADPKAARRTRARRQLKPR